MPMLNGVDYIIGHSTILLTMKAGFLPQLVGKRERVQEILESFLLRVAIGTNGGSMKVSFPQIIPSNDLSMPHKLEEKRDFGPDTR